MSKILDINYDRRPENECDSVELLMCIQAWHEMLNPGHHSLKLHSDGSGIVEAAPNYPPMYKISVNYPRHKAGGLNLGSKSPVRMGD